MFRFLFALAFVTLNQAAADPLSHEETATGSLVGGNNLMRDETNERHLLRTLRCPGGGPLTNFPMEIDIIPHEGYSKSKCTTDHMTAIRVALNNLLYDYGVRPGVGDSAVFSAQVCSTPVPSNRRRLVAPKFKWPGVGVCRYCEADNGDARRGLKWNDHNWFKKTYAPELETKLRDAITNNVVSNFVLCLGRTPKVTVLVKEVPRYTPPLC